MISLKPAFQCGDCERRTTVFNITIPHASDPRLQLVALSEIVVSRLKQ